MVLEFEEIHEIDVGNEKVLPAEFSIGKLEYNGQYYKALFPIDNGILFRFTHDEAEKVYSEIESMVLNRLLSMAKDTINVNLVDFGLQSSFPNLMKLKGSIKNTIHHLRDYRQFKSKLMEVREKITEIVQYKLNSHKDIYEYNENIDELIKYEIFVMDLRVEVVKDNELELMELIKNSNKYGIIFIMLLNEDYFNSKIMPESYESIMEEMKSNKTTYLIEYIEDNFSTIDMDNSSKIYNVEEYYKTIFERMKYTFSNDNEFSKNKAIGIIEEKYRVISAEEENNFLSIPIGIKEGKTFNFEMGDRNKAFSFLITGQTGSGKSNILNHIITKIGLNYTPDEIRLILMDYKEGLEFKEFQDLPHVEKLVLDNERIELVLELLEDWQRQFLVRKRLFNQYGGVKNLDAYNAVAEKKLPRYICIIDEFSKLFSIPLERRQYQYLTKFNLILKDIVQRGRGFGFHLILSTQTLVDVDLTASIKSNIKGRLSFQLGTSSDCIKALDSNNEAPLYLNKYGKYHFVYNTENGNKEFNEIAKSERYLSSSEIQYAVEESIKKYGDYVDFEKIVIESQDEEEEFEDNDDIRESEENREFYNNELLEEEEVIEAKYTDEEIERLTKKLRKGSRDESE